jgi:hypothetical protein
LWFPTGGEVGRREQFVRGKTGRTAWTFLASQRLSVRWRGTFDHGSATGDECAYYDTGQVQLGGQARPTASARHLSLLVRETAASSSKRNSRTTAATASAAAGPATAPSIRLATGIYEDGRKVRDL